MYKQKLVKLRGEQNEIAILSNELSDFRRWFDDGYKDGRMKDIVFKMISKKLVDLSEESQEIEKEIAKIPSFE